MTKRWLAYFLLCVGCGASASTAPEVESREQPVSPTHCATEETTVFSAPPMVSTSRARAQLARGERLERIPRPATSMGAPPDDYWQVRLNDGSYGYAASAALQPLESAACADR